jgi:alpha-ketoglutarate-dependent taurine dioxygenase
MQLNNVAIADQVGLPVIIELPELTPDAFVSFYHDNKAEIEEQLARHGALKFRGVQIDSAETFQRITNAISSKFLNYIDGNSPRTKVTGTVYTSTEYDNTQRITMHNELSYSAKWPGKLFFTCIQPSETGGETLLADSREILNQMSDSIKTKISEKGIIYIRNLHGGTGMGPSWQDTFETDDPRQVEAYCDQYGIEYEWGDNDMLKVSQPSKGIIAHRNTGEKLWFNQLDQFHPLHIGEELLEALTTLYGSPDSFPMYVTFGDGTAIPDGMVKEIMDTIDQTIISPVWQKNELLIVDNEMVSHGRNPFTGERKVLVAMCE